MMTMKIDEEFQKIIPELTQDEFNQLKENILIEGCRDALVVWNDIIVDGHNRYKICTENNITFTTKDIDFKSREEAKEWIIRNQLGRRNLAPYQRLELAEKLEVSIKAKAKEKQKEYHGNQYERGLLSISTKVQKPIDTRKELAQIAGVGSDSVRKFKVIQKEGTEKQKERARQGGKGNTINAIYGEIEQEKIKSKVCTKCGEEKPSDKFLSGKNICRECDNKIRRKPVKAEPIETPINDEPIEEDRDPRFNIDLYDLSTVPEYTMDFVAEEIEGIRRELSNTLDVILEQQGELIHKGDNVSIFNGKLNQIINELKERLQ